jgi:hypothetical protein
VFTGRIISRHKGGDETVNINKTLPANPHWQKRTETKFIILHHAEAEHCTIDDIDYWHLIQNGWEGGCGYNLFVDKQGTVWEGRPLDVVGAHTKGYNEKSIGICFEGNFENEDMPEVQMNAGIELLKWLRQTYKVPVLRHRDVNDTKCPGSNFRNYIILEGMKEAMPNKDDTHWANPIWEELNKEGIVINEKRFEDTVKRGELLAVVSQVIKLIKKLN